MKFVFVLLAIVAFATAAPEPRGVIDYAEGLINDFVNGVSSTVDRIWGEVKSVSSGAISRGDSIVSVAMNAVTTLTAQVEGEINNLIARGGAARTCAMTQMAQLTDIKTNAITKVNGCANDITSAVAFFETDMSARVTNLKSNASGLGSMAWNCVKQVLDAVTCLISSVNKGYVMVADISDTIYGAIDTAKATIDGTVVRAQTCATSTVDMVKVQVQQIAVNVARCI